MNNRSLNQRYPVTALDEHVSDSLAISTIPVVYHWVLCVLFPGVPATQQKRNLYWLRGDKYRILGGILSWWADGRVKHGILATHFALECPRGDIHWVLGTYCAVAWHKEDMHWVPRVHSSPQCPWVSYIGYLGPILTLSVNVGDKADAPRRIQSGSLCPRMFTGDCHGKEEINVKNDKYELRS